MINKKNLFNDKTIANIVDLLEHEMKPYWPLPKRLKNPKSAIDSATEVWYEIFPHPYHV